MSSATANNPMDAATVILSAIVLSCVGALFYNLLPMFMGSVQDSKGLGNSAIGFISTAFFFGYNVVTLWAFYWIRKWSWRLVTLVAVPIAGIGLYATTRTENYPALLLATAISGGAFAAVYGIGTTILSDTSNPARWFGLKIAAEASTGAVLLLILPGTLIASYGFDGMVAGMLLTMLCASPLLLLLPTSGMKTHAQEVADYMALDAQPESLNHWAIWSALAATLIFFSGTSAVWAFMERLGNSAGYDPGAIATLLAVTLVCATLGSLGAATIGRYFGNVGPFLVSTAVILGALVLLGSAASFPFYVAGCCLFTAAFGAGLPFAVAEIAELDVDGRYVVLSVPAIGMGAMIGPGTAGMLYSGDSALHILQLVALAMLLAAAMMWYAHRQKNAPQG